jgi:cytochrome P450
MLARLDTTVIGQPLRAGEFVFLMAGAANRDESQFDDAEQLDNRRRPNHHLAFELGVHFSLGAALARLEARVALSTLPERFGRISLARDSISPPQHRVSRVGVVACRAFDDYRRRNAYGPSRKALIASNLDRLLLACQSLVWSS